MDEHTDLDVLVEEASDALRMGVKEFKIKTYVDGGLHRALEISRRFRQEDYDTQIIGEKDVDRGAGYATRYSVIVKSKKVD